MTRRCSILALTMALLGAAGPQHVRADDRAPSREELRALVDRVIASQHRNDAALEQYERTERRQLRKSGQGAAPADDRTFRVVPTGTGILRVQVEENGQPVDAQVYRRQLRELEHTLASALDANQPRQKQAAAKFAKRQRERAEMVDAVRDAFQLTWLGRETRNGRALAKLALDPNPNYKPASRNTSLFLRVRATIWVDEAAGQLARVEAELIRDIRFGGGVIAKVYRGGRFVLEQAEVAPGAWLPTRYDYNFEGRKFLFGFELHELTEASHYRRLGPPAEALLAIRRELSNTPDANSPH